MGLDMYLEKRTYVKNWSHEKKSDQVKITVKQGGKNRKDIDIKKISYIIEEIGYWRKANAIHNFFIENCGEGIDKCQSIHVGSEQLVDLLDKCNEIIKNSKLVNCENCKTMKDGAVTDAHDGVKYIEYPTIARKLLPTQSGFFFGGTDYDEYYLNDIQETKKICEEALKAMERGAEIYYQASW